MLIGRLHVGDRLNFGESLVSLNGEHALTVQKDGNLVLYRKGRAEWHTDTANRPQASGSSYAAVEADGNFVVAHKFWGYRWKSLSSGYGARRPYVVVEDDGVISIYDDEEHGRHWCSGDFPDEISGLFNEYTLTKVCESMFEHVAMADIIRRGISRNSVATQIGRRPPVPNSRHSDNGLKS